MMDSVLKNGISERNKIDFDIDAVAAVGTILASILRFVPVVGNLLDAIVAIFWPKESKDVWAQIREKVKDLVDEEIDDNEWGILQEKIMECEIKLKAIVEAMKSGQISVIRDLYIGLTGFFIGIEENFKIKGHNIEYFFSPAYCAIVSVVLAFRLEIIHNGTKFGIKEEEIYFEKKHVESLINKSIEYITYVKNEHNKNVSNSLEKSGMDSYYNDIFTFNMFIQSGALIYLQIWDVSSLLNKKDILIDLGFPGVIFQVPYLDRTRVMTGAEIYSTMTPVNKNNKIKNVTLVESIEYDVSSIRPTGFIVAYEDTTESMGYLGQPHDMQVSEHNLDCSTSRWDHLSVVIGESAGFVDLLTLETDEGKSVTIGHHHGSIGSLKLKWPYRIGKIFVPDDDIGYFYYQSGHQMTSAGFGVVYDNDLAQEAARRLSSYFSSDNEAG